MQATCTSSTQRADRTRRTRLPSESVGVARKPGLRRRLRAARRRRGGRARGRARLARAACILFASGYAETGKPERIAQQTAAVAARGGVGPSRILGPNCLGIGNYALGARITFSEYPAVRPLRAASVGIASQSGALSQSLAQSIETGVSVSHSFSAGNQVGRRRRRPRRLPGRGGRVPLDRLRVRRHVAPATVARGGGTRVEATASRC